MSHDDHLDLDPGIADAVLRAYVRPVDEDTARRHVDAIVAAATIAGSPTAGRRPVRRRRVWVRGLAIGGATLFSPVGLALAGVSLPKVVNAPYAAAGISLPHQTAQRPQQLTPAAPAPGQPRLGGRQDHPAIQAGEPHSPRRHVHPTVVKPRPQPTGSNRPRKQATGSAGRLGTNATTGPKTHQPGPRRPIPLPRRARTGHHTRGAHAAHPAPASGQPTPPGSGNTAASREKHTSKH